MAKTFQNARSHLGKEIWERILSDATTLLTWMVSPSAREVCLRANHSLTHSLIHSFTHSLSVPLKKRASGMVLNSKRAHKLCNQKSASVRPRTHAQLLTRPHRENGHNAIALNKFAFSFQIKRAMETWKYPKHTQNTLNTHTQNTYTQNTYNTQNTHRQARAHTHRWAVGLLFFCATDARRTVKKVAFRPTKQTC